MTGCYDHHQQQRLVDIAWLYGRLACCRDALERRDLWMRVVLYGDVDLVELIVRRNCWPDDTETRLHAFKAAARCGHHELLSWLRECDVCGWNASVCSELGCAAAAGDQLGTLQWLHTLDEFSWHPCALGEAANRGHLECVEYALDNGGADGIEIHTRARRGGEASSIERKRRRDARF